MPASRKKSSRQNWSRLSKENLLDMRICDLCLTLETSPLQKRIDQLYRELARKQINFQPHFWLSDEWFCPDGVPGVAIPFFLAHPRLRRLEYDFMMEVEGGDHRWFMRLIRHETGHALLNAYQLNQRRDWRKVFGNPNSKYPDIYLPKPYSKRFVNNLPNWYAQSHPHEDWAETFAVWLNPASDWRKRYRNWPALRKLIYVDELIEEIKTQPLRLRNRRTDSPVAKLKYSLREYYEDKIARYGTDSPEFFDRDLLKLFVPAERAPHAPRATTYIRSQRKAIMDTVERWTGEYKYRIDTVLKDMIIRCRQLDLRVDQGYDDLMPEMTACLTMLVMNKLHSGGFHIAL